MRDREMLEFAAKAAGIGGGRQFVRGRDTPICYRDVGGRVWNPINDDGDALRLMVKLDLSSLVIFPSAGGKRREFWTPNSGHDNGNAATTEAEYAADPLAATRRAIVRAAAEIGRQMP